MRERMRKTMTERESNARENERERERERRRERERKREREGAGGSNTIRKLGMNAIKQKAINTVGKLAALYSPINQNLPSMKPMFTSCQIMCTFLLAGWCVLQGHLDHKKKPPPRRTLQ